MSGWYTHRLRHVLAGIVRASDAFAEGEHDLGLEILRSLELDVAELVAELEHREAA